MPVWAAVLALAAAAIDEPTDAGIAPAREGEVVVTARRRPENAQSVPAAVDALPGDVLERLPVRDVLDLQRYVPSLQVAQFARDEATLLIRGQGPGTGAFPGVLTYQNEVPFRGLGDGFYYDLTNVQVLKGPQGTLFGRNANGGAVLFTTAAPTDQPGGYVQGQLGNLRDRELQGALNVPLSGDQLMLRIAGAGATRAGYTRVAGRDTELDDRGYAAGRASLRWAPSATIRHDVVADYTRIRTNGGAALLTAINPASPIALLPASVGGALRALLARQQQLGPRAQAGISVDPTRQVDQYGVSDRFEWTVSDALAITNIAAYRRYRRLFRADYDGTALALIDYSITPDGYELDDEQVTEELQLHGDVERFHYTAGAYLQDNRPGGPQRQIGVAFFQPSQIIAEARDLSRALYGQVDYDASPWLGGLKLTVGGRYTWDRRAQRAATRNLLTGACSGVGAMPPGCLLDGVVRFSAPSWTASAAWQATPRTLAYLTTRRGYKSGGLNLGQPIAAATVYRPEYITDVELGLKTDIALGGAASLRLNVDGYRGYYQDIQVNAIIADPSRSAAYAIIENGATATIQGIEADATLVVTPRLQIDGGYAFTDAHYDRYISTVYGDQSGAPWPYTARHKGSITATWRLPTPASIGPLSFAAHASVQSALTFGYTPGRSTFEPGYTLVDFRLDWRHPNGAPFDLSVFAANVTDRVYRTNVLNLYNSVGIDSSAYGEPRTYGLRLRYAFGDMRS